MHRRRHFILPSVVALSLLSWFAAPLSAKPNKPRDVIELRILEFVHGEAKPVRERSLTVPLSGTVLGWADLFDEPGSCRLRVEPLHDDIAKLALDCHTRAGDRPTLQLHVERAFVRDESCLLGIVDTQSDHRLEVHATRR